MRTENYVDLLAMLTSAVDFQFRREIPIEHILKPSIHKLDEEVFCLDHSSGWTDPIISFLKDEMLPKAQKLQHIDTTHSSESSYTKNHIPDCITIPIWGVSGQKKPIMWCEKSTMATVETTRVEGLSHTKPSTKNIISLRCSKTLKGMWRGAHNVRGSPRLPTDLVWSPYSIKFRALHAMGAWCGKSSSPYKASVQIFTSRHKLLLKMDKCNTSLQYHMAVNC